MNCLILFLFFLIVTHTPCFSIANDDALSSEEVLIAKRRGISEQYKECKRRDELHEYSADLAFQEETDRLRTIADDGMMELAKAGYVEARIWREKRELQRLEYHHDTILLSLEKAKNELKEKKHGIYFEEISRLNIDLQGICEHLYDCQNNLNLLKELKKKKIEVVRDTQYYLDNNINLFTLCDKDGDTETKEQQKLVPVLRIPPASITVTYDVVRGFKRNVQKTLNDLIELETDLLPLGTAKTQEVLKLIKDIRGYIKQNNYLDSTADLSDDFITFIFAIIRESIDYSYSVKPSFGAVNQLRDMLLNTLIRFSDDKVTPVEVLMSLADCLLTPSNKHNILDTIERMQAEFQIVSEIKRYLNALSDPNNYAKLVYRKLFQAKNANKIRQCYMNDVDSDSFMYVDSLFEPVNDRFFTLQTFFINASYAPYKTLLRPDMVAFMAFGRKHFRMSVTDIEKYVRNKNKSDCPYYVYVQPAAGKPVQTILISKKGPYSIRYHHEQGKLTIGLLYDYPYDISKNRWASNTSGLLVCDGENEIIKYARYDILDFVSPANRLHRGGFLNASSYNEEKRVLDCGHF